MPHFSPARHRARRSSGHVRQLRRLDLRFDREPPDSDNVSRGALVHDTTGSPEVKRHSRCHWPDGHRRESFTNRPPLARRGPLRAAKEAFSGRTASLLPSALSGPVCKVRYLEVEQLRNSSLERGQRTGRAICADSEQTPRRRTEFIPLRVPMG